MSKKAKIITIVAVATVLIVVAVWYFFFKNPKVDAISQVVTMPSGGTQVVTNNNTAAPLANDNFPLQIGSKGNRVKIVQEAINRIMPIAALKTDGSFGQKTYESLITYVGVRFYPIDTKNYVELLQLSNK